MTRERSLRIGFIGPGTVGRALAQGFASNGYRVTSLFGRNPDRLASAVSHVPGAIAVRSAQDVVDRSNLIFLTVPDDAIESVAEGLVWREDISAVHCSGVASTGFLLPAARAGASTGAFHPLQTLATVEQALRNLSGSTFAIEASTPRLEEILCELASAVGGHPVTIDGSKALYHASAVLASNCLVTLVDAAAGLWDHLGLSKEEGLRALLPLIRGTIENLETVGLPKALTGPVSRGDLGTVEANLKALQSVSPEAAALYADMALRTIPVARAKGTLDSESEARLRSALAEIQPEQRKEGV